MKTEKIEIYAGCDINAACEKAVIMAKAKHCYIEFEFNGQKLIALPTSASKSLAQSYKNESRRLHEEYIASPEYKKQQEDYQRKEKEKKDKLANMLKNAPEHMSLRDNEGWKKICEKNTDSYGGTVIIYAERWAQLMEVRKASGEQIADIAEECSHLADIEGITGFMYGCAVGILSKVWLYGEELRVWHNLDTQISNEGELANKSGGVLNPALLNIK